MSCCYQRGSVVYYWAPSDCQTTTAWEMNTQERRRRRTDVCCERTVVKQRAVGPPDPFCATGGSGVMGHTPSSRNGGREPYFICYRHSPGLQVMIYNYIEEGVSIIRQQTNGVLEGIAMAGFALLFRNHGDVDGFLVRPSPRLA